MTGVRDLSARFHGVRYSLGRKESCASPLWGAAIADRSLASRLGEGRFGDRRREDQGLALWWLCWRTVTAIRPPAIAAPPMNTNVGSVEGVFETPDRPVCGIGTT